MAISSIVSIVGFCEPYRNVVKVDRGSELSLYAMICMVLKAGRAKRALRWREGVFRFYEGVPDGSQVGVPALTYISLSLGGSPRVHRSTILILLLCSGHLRVDGSGVGDPDVKSCCYRGQHGSHVVETRITAFAHSKALESAATAAAAACCL